MKIILHAHVGIRVPFCVHTSTHGVFVGGLETYCSLSLITDTQPQKRRKPRTMEEKDFVALMADFHLLRDVSGILFDRQQVSKSSSIAADAKAKRIRSPLAQKQDHLPRAIATVSASFHGYSLRLLETSRRLATDSSSRLMIGDVPNKLKDLKDERVNFVTLVQKVIGLSRQLTEEEILGGGGGGSDVYDAAPVTEKAKMPLPEAIARFQPKDVHLRNLLILVCNNSTQLRVLASLHALLEAVHATHRFLRNPANRARMTASQRAEGDRTVGEMKVWVATCQQTFRALLDALPSASRGGNDHAIPAAQQIAKIRASVEAFLGSLTVEVNLSSADSESQHFALAANPSSSGENPPSVAVDGVSQQQLGLADAGEPKQPTDSPSCVEVTFSPRSHDLTFNRSSLSVPWGVSFKKVGTKLHIANIDGWRITSTSQRDSTVVERIDGNLPSRRAHKVSEKLANGGFLTMRIRMAATTFSCARDPTWRAKPAPMEPTLPQVIPSHPSVGAAAAKGVKGFAVKLKADRRTVTLLRSDAAVPWGVAVRCITNKKRRSSTKKVFLVSVDGWTVEPSRKSSAALSDNKGVRIDTVNRSIVRGDGSHLEWVKGNVMTLRLGEKLVKVSPCVVPPPQLTSPGQGESNEGTISGLSLSSSATLAASQGVKGYSVEFDATSKVLTLRRDNAAVPWGFTLHRRKAKIFLSALEGWSFKPSDHPAILSAGGNPLNATHESDLDSLPGLTLQLSLATGIPHLMKISSCHDAADTGAEKPTQLGANTGVLEQPTSRIVEADGTHDGAVPTTHDGSVTNKAQADQFVSSTVDAATVVDVASSSSTLGNCASSRTSQSENATNSVTNRADVCATSEIVSGVSEQANPLVPLLSTATNGNATTDIAVIGGSPSTAPTIVTRNDVHEMNGKILEDVPITADLGSPSSPSNDTSPLNATSTKVKAILLSPTCIRLVRSHADVRLGIRIEDKGISLLPVTSYEWLNSSMDASQMSCLLRSASSADQLPLLAVNGAVVQGAKRHHIKIQKCIAGAKDITLTFAESIVRPGATIPAQASLDADAEALRSLTVMCTFASPNMIHITRPSLDMEWGIHLLQSASNAPVLLTIPGHKQLRGRCTIVSVNGIACASNVQTAEDCLNGTTEAFLTVLGRALIASHSDPSTVIRCPGRHPHPRRDDVAPLLDTDDGLASFSTQPVLPVASLVKAAAVQCEVSASAMLLTRKSALEPWPLLCVTKSNDGQKRSGKELHVVLDKNRLVLSRCTKGVARFFEELSNQEVVPHEDIAGQRKMKLFKLRLRAVGGETTIDHMIRRLRSKATMLALRFK